MVIDPFVPILDEIRKIHQASAARDPWAVLGIPPMASFKQIKSAQRKWIRRLHPDKWHASSDAKLRDDIQEAFYQVQAAYFESLKHCAGNAADFQPITTPPAPRPGWFRRLMTLLRAA